MNPNRLPPQTRRAILQAIGILDSVAFVSQPGDTETPLANLRRAIVRDDDAARAERVLAANPGVSETAHVPPSMRRGVFPIRWNVSVNMGQQYATVYVRAVSSQSALIRAGDYLRGIGHPEASPQLAEVAMDQRGHVHAQ